MTGYERVYRNFFDFVAPHAELVRGWGEGGPSNRFLMIAPRSSSDGSGG